MDYQATGGYLNVDVQQGNARQGAVTQAYGELNTALGVLGEHVELLAHRLEPVLCPDTPTAGVAAKGTVAQGSPFTDSIRSDTERVRYLTTRIQSLLDRIEV